MSFDKAPWIAALLTAAALHVAPVNAETFKTCAGFIEAVPAVITTQGVWCLKKDLATSMTSGNAITIATNNVTIDCNGFKIGGLGAGIRSGANGVVAQGRQNASVRNCAVRGFFYGVVLHGSGHVVQDNRLDQNLYFGIHVAGENNRVKNNAVYDTGGSPNQPYSYGIYAHADVIDNTVAGVYSTEADSYTYGIWAFGKGGNELSGNRVRNLLVSGSGHATGIYISGLSGMTIADNRVSAEVPTAGYGIYDPNGDSFCIRNTVVNFATAYLRCVARDGNLSLPAVP